MSSAYYTVDLVEIPLSLLIERWTPVIGGLRPVQSGHRLLGAKALEGLQDTVHPFGQGIYS
jgi:hypothetical protein